MRTKCVSRKKSVGTFFNVRHWQRHTLTLMTSDCKWLQRTFHVRTSAIKRNESHPLCIRLQKIKFVCVSWRWFSGTFVAALLPHSGQFHYARKKAPCSHLQHISLVFWEGNDVVAGAWPTSVLWCLVDSMPSGVTGACPNDVVHWLSGWQVSRLCSLLTCLFGMVPTA